MNELAPRCSTCGSPMLLEQRKKHYACDDTVIAGKTCTCPIGCSATAYGNGRISCDPSCDICRLLHGTPLKRSRKA